MFLATLACRTFRVPHFSMYQFQSALENSAMYLQVYNPIQVSV